MSRLSWELRSELIELAGTVSSSPLTRAVVVGEGLSRSILRTDGESGEDGVTGRGKPCVRR